MTPEICESGLFSLCLRHFLSCGFQSLSKGSWSCLAKTDHAIVILSHFCGHESMWLHNMAHSCTWEVEAGVLLHIWCLPGLRNEFWDSLRYRVIPLFVSEVRINEPGIFGSCSLWQVKRLRIGVILIAFPNSFWDQNLCPWVSETPYL